MPDSGTQLDTLETPTSWWQKFKARPMYSWTISYITFCWLVVRVVAAALALNNFPDWVGQGATLLMIAGLPIVMTLAYYHGERKQTRVSLAEGIIISLLGILTIGYFSDWFGASDSSEALTATVEPNALQAQPQYVVQKEDPAAREGRLAVLPFENLSTSEEEQFWSDGLTDDILMAVSQLPGLEVISRKSAFAFRDQDVTADSIGKALRVEHLLEGSVRKIGELVRINVWLVSTRDNAQKWSQSFDGPREEIFSLQDQISRAVGKALQLRVPKARLVNSTSRVDPKAYDLMLEGRELLTYGSGDAKVIERAIKLLEQAYKLDAKITVAKAVAASGYFALQRYHPEQAESLIAKSKALAQEALLDNPDEPTALTIMAYIATYIERDYAAGDRFFEQAHAANPTKSSAIANLAGVRLRNGDREEAQKLAVQAVKMSPRDPVTLSNSGYVLYNLHDFEGAADIYASLVSLAPENAVSRISLADCLSKLGKHTEALREATRAVEIGTFDPEIAVSAASIHARAGQEETALALLARVPKGNFVLKASTYAELGDTSSVYVMLDSALVTQDRQMTMLEEDPAFKGWWELAEMQKYKRGAVQ